MIKNNSKATSVFVALLRGINVGGKNKIEMAKLKQTFEKLDFAHVQTFIASGNVIFHTDIKDKTILTKKIEDAIKNDFGILTKVLLISLHNMDKLVNEIPASWVNDKNMKCDVMFLWKDIDNKDILKQLPFDPILEDILYLPGAVIWRINRKNISKSKMFKIVGTKLFQQMTVRNPNTVRKLYKLMLK